MTESTVAAAEEAILREEVGSQLDDLRKELSGVSMRDLRSGDWFATFAARLLRNYTAKVDAAYFQAKYPNLPVDEMVDRQVALAKNYAMIGGGLMAGVSSGAVAATVGSGGGASPLTAPAWMVSVVVDLAFMTRLQLRLAYDMSVLYGAPVDIDDPTEVLDLFKVALGVKAGELLHSGMSKLVPEAVRVGVKSVASGATLAWLKALPVVGRHLLQRNLIKFAIPVVSVPVAMGVNRWTTSSVARMARKVFRQRTIGQQVAAELADDGQEFGLLLMRVLLAVARADGKQAMEEARLLEAVASELVTLGEEDAVGAFRSVLDLDEDALVAEVRRQPTEVRGVLVAAAEEMARADGKVVRKEKRLVAKLKMSNERVARL